MTVEEYLKQYPAAWEEMHWLEAEIISIKSKASDAEEPLHGHDNMVKVQTYKISDPTYKTAQKYADVYAPQIAALEKELAGWKAVVDRIDRIVMTADLTGKERQYVRMRYKENRTIGAICGEIKGKDGKRISATTADRLRKSALSKIEKVMP
jgi:trehalose-6-phosphate synthase